jgi:hypothetical protein
MTKSPETMLELLVPLLDPQIGVLTFSFALMMQTKFCRNYIWMQKLYLDKLLREKTQSLKMILFD